MSLNIGSLDISRQVLKVGELQTDKVIFINDDLMMRPSGNAISILNIAGVANRDILVGIAQAINSVKTNTIIERSSGVGVDIDGLIIKDEGINFPTNDIRLLADITDRLALRNIANDAFSNLIASEVRGVSNIKTDTILERNADQGVNIDGVLVKDNKALMQSLEIINVGAGDNPVMESNSTSKRLSIVDNITTPAILVNDIVERGTDAGVLVEGILFKDSEIETMGITFAKLLKAMVYGSANKIFIACASIVLTDGKFETTVVKAMINITAQGGYMMFSFPKPTNKNGLKLFIKDIQVILRLADTDNKISTIWLMGVNSGGSVTEIDFDTSNLYPAGTHTWSRSAIDVSAYSAINIHLFATNDNIGALELVSVRAEYYYE